MQVVGGRCRILAEHDRDEPAALEPAAPVISRALPTALLDFLTAEKAEDRYASVPELIRRALQLGVIGPHQRADRFNEFHGTVVSLAATIARAVGM